MNNFKTIPEIAQWHAKGNGERTAFIFGEAALTYAAYNELANKVAHGLQSLQVQYADKIAFIGKDSQWAYEILMGSAKAQTVFVPVNWKLAASEIQYILHDAQVCVLFVEQDYHHIAQKIKSDLPALRHVIVLDAANTESVDYELWRDVQRGGNSNLSYRDTDAVVQVYTSGTTGRPKGVQLAHYSFFTILQPSRAQGDKWMDLNPEDVLLLAVPIFHIGGMWWNLQCFISGAKGIIMESFVAWKALENIERFKVNKMAMVPAMIQFLMAEPSSKSANLTSLKYILYGGSPITPALRKQAMEVLGCEFFQIYGMTETGNCAVTLRPDEHNDKKRKNAAGRPFFGVEIKILDADKNEVPTGQSGEIWIKSPAVMLGYWNNEDATARTLQDGWIRTGDGGYLDDEGFVYVSDRIKDMIIAAGENVFPAEVEAAISEHPDVKDVAVIGIPDELWGEAVKAFVILKEGKKVSARELVLFARDRIADFKTPRSISFVEELPRNAAGKVLKTELRKPYWENQDRFIN